jgi:hypothetical protein
MQYTRESIAYRVLVKNPEGMKPLRTSRHIWEDIIKIDVREIGCARGLDSSG